MRARKSVLQGSVPLMGSRAADRWLPAIAVMSSAVMELLDTSVVNVSLPHIAGTLSATVEEASWVLTSYIIANAIILPISGWLAGRFGRKRLLMTVVTGFTVSSLLCGAASSLSGLIVFRVLQGTTGGGLQPLSQAVLLEAFPVEERGYAMAFWGLGMIAAPTLGPMVGGWITDNYSWRWVFYVNLPVGLLSLAMIHRFVKDPPYLRRVTRKADLRGLAMLAVGMGAFQIMLDKGQEEDWFSSRLIVALAVITAVMLPAFVARELSTAEPLVDFRLLRQATYAAGVFVVTVLGFVLYGSIILLPLFMQTLLGFSALGAGIWSAPRGVGSMLFMPLTALVMKRRGDPRLLLTAGLLFVSAAFFGWARLDLQAGAYDLLWPQLLQGMGFAMIFVPLTTITMDPIPLESMGYATSIYSLMRNVGSSLGISFVTTLLARRTQFHQARLGESVTAYSGLTGRTLERYAGLFRSHGNGLFEPAQRALGVLYRGLQQQAHTMSFLDAFRILGVLFLAVTPIVWLMRRPRRERPAGLAA